MAEQLELGSSPFPLADLLDRVRRGEEITLTQAGLPVAKIVPVGPNPHEQAWGLFKGKGWVADDFDAPLPEEELREWEK